MNNFTIAAYKAWHNLKNDTQAKLFYWLYVSVAVATFRHSSYGFATLEGGSVVLGALSALALDVGMILSATGLRRTRNWSLIAGLAVSAVASTYTQWLFAMMHAEAIPVAPGALWIESLARLVIDGRVVLLPALLPTLAVLYARSADVRHTEQDTIEQAAARIRGETDASGERAEQIWRLQGSNGYRKLSAKEVAELARCHEVTARKAKSKLKGA